MRLPANTAIDGQHVSIHAPVWGATSSLICIVCPRLFQSTHPCGVRPINGLSGAADIVSIHAPVWGATSGAGNAINFIHVSIHAPVWGATMILAKQSPPFLFQSTHPCGVRPCPPDLKAVSYRFQSTHPCGVRLCGLLARFYPASFQSTHPCGVRPYSNLSITCSQKCFNPRTRVGCDPCIGTYD